MHQSIIFGLLLTTLNILDESYGFATKINNHPAVDPLGVLEKELIEIRNDIIEKTNHYRKKFQTPTLDINEQINNYAQERANEMAKYKQDKNVRNINPFYGENRDTLYCFPYMGELAVDLWYYSLKYINAGNNEEQLYENTKAYPVTQILWKESKNIGVGVAKDSDNVYYIVVDYFPAGNVKNKFISNLPDFKTEDIKEAIEKEKQMINGILKFHESKNRGYLGYRGNVTPEKDKPIGKNFQSYKKQQNTQNNIRKENSSSSGASINGTLPGWRSELPRA